MVSWPQAIAEGERILVPTHCLYPSNSAVTVVVEGGRHEFLVHDDAGALDELTAAGACFTRIDGLVRQIVRAQGLEISENGIIHSRIVNTRELAATIVLIANASKEAAHELLSRFKPRMRRNFRAELGQLLELRFPKLVSRDVPIVGASNKPHKFHHAVRLGGERQLLIDAVIHEASSINAAVVANLDVRNLRYPNIEQRIIYDDSEAWAAADLNLLRVGAPAVPFSRAPEVLDRIAA
jgi:hypothetical protein